MWSVYSDWEGVLPQHNDNGTLNLATWSEKVHLMNGVLTNPILKEAETQTRDPGKACLMKLQKDVCKPECPQGRSMSITLAINCALMRDLSDPGS